MKKILIPFILGTFIMQAADPFSYKEILNIEDFPLKKPSYITASDGTHLAYYNFSHLRDTAITVLYAGAGLYGNKTYQWIAKTLHEKYGIGCYIFDLRGHGYSQGKRGDAPTMERVWADIQEALAFVRTNHKDATIYLLGHSSGAGVIINYAAHNQKPIEDAYIFLAPFLGPKSGTEKNHGIDGASFIKNSRSWVYIAGSLFPNSFFTHLKAVEFNYSPEILRADPLILSGYTYAMSCATSPYDIESIIKSIHKPTAIFIGSKDEQFDPEKVINFGRFISAPTHSEIVPDVGHLSILLEAPRLVAKAIKL